MPEPTAPPPCAGTPPTGHRAGEAAAGVPAAGVPVAGDPTPGAAGSRPRGRLAVLADERGAATAEYAVATMATVVRLGHTSASGH